MRRPKAVKAISLILLCLASAAFTAILAPAQVHVPDLPGKWWKRPMVVERLGLTNEQVSKIESIWMEHRKQLIDLRADAEKKQVDLETLIAKEDFDENAIKAQIDRVFSARAEIEKVRIPMVLRIRNVLTPEQRAKLEALRAEFMRRPPDGRTQ